MKVKIFRSLKLIVAKSVFMLSYIPTYNTMFIAHTGEKADYKLFY